MTEDQPGHSGFYRFLPKDTSGTPGSYEAGGRLQSARVIGRPNADLRNPRVGDLHHIDWVDIADPDQSPGVEPSTVSRLRKEASGPSVQAWNGRGTLVEQGGRHQPACREVLRRRFRGGRGQPCTGPVTATAPSGSSIPSNSTLRAIFVAGSQIVGDNIDNITVSPRGGILMCEDGDPVTDRYGPGTRLIGLTGEGDSYAFAKNNVKLGLEQLVTAGKHVPPNDYRGEEWAGACFDANGEVLFANIQTPGITFAIWGPWERGNL